MQRPMLFIAGALIVLVGLFELLKPLPLKTVKIPSAPAQPTAAAAVNTAPAPVAAPAAQVFAITIHRGQRVSGPAQIQVHEGDHVSITLTSDEADELHLHGYDLHVDLRAGEPATLAFEAIHSGHFDYELHHAHSTLGALDVLPR